MMRKRFFLFMFPAVLALAAVSCAPGSSVGSAAGPAPVTSMDVLAPRVGEAIDVPLRYDGEIADPIADAVLHVTVTPPRNDMHIRRFEGFFDGAGTWKARFVPDRPGVWAVDLRLEHAGRTVAEKRASLDCKSAHDKGFLRISRVNPYRFVWDDGTPFYPVGIQPGGQKTPGLDGPVDRTWRSVPFRHYLDEFQGKANLFRIQLGQGTGAGCAQQVLKVDEDGKSFYDFDEARSLDVALRDLRAHGFAVILIPFQDMSLWGHSKGAFGHNRDLAGWKNIRSPIAQKEVKQYLRYLVARYAAYTDIWEIFNEDSFTPDEWLREMAALISAHDPYAHIVTTNYERPSEPWCRVVCVHEYMWMPADEVDAHLCKELLRFKSFGKPVLYTEFGNQNPLSNKDPVKWRVAVWTAFMNEAGILFWHMGGRFFPETTEHRGGNANAYLGPEARSFFKIFLEFVADVPVSLRPAMIGYGEKGDEFYRYALSNGKLTLLYMNNHGNHGNPAKGTIYVWTGPGTFNVKWIDPATGDTVKTEQITAKNGNMCVFKTPEFTEDLAARMDRVD
ncbi:MAG: DUF5060 domain-containing protein [Planctomycetes bacterium]|nr:DUF5060 domain-containing protein [Planctomycetota bacterium]